MPPVSPSFSPSVIPSRPRRGQLLLECLIALVLVAVAGLAFAAASVSAITLGDDALQLARAQREQGNDAGLALLAPCDTGARHVATTRWPTPRLRVDVALTGSAPLVRSRVEVRWTASSLAFASVRELHVSSAGRCR